MKIAALASLLALSACVVYEDEADLTLEWDASACIELGASVVRVELFQDRYYGTGLLTRVPCLDGGVVFEELEPDTYIVFLDAESEPGLPLVRIEDTIPVRPGDNVFSYRF